MTFKKLIEAMANGTPVNELCGMIDISFQQDKITWKEHEILYALVRRLRW